MSSTTNQATLIHNPNAGYDDWQHAIDAVAAFWREQGWTLSVQNTRGPGHATELAAAAAAAGHRLVIAAGGDGTLHEAANGLIGAPCALAPLPAGTTNCLTRDLGLPKPDDGNPHWLLDSSRWLLNGRLQAVDVGACSNGKHWLLWAGAGIESRIVEFVEPRSGLLKRFGFAGYFAKAAWPFLTFAGSAMRVAVDGQVVAGDFLSVTICNSRLFAGGMFTLNPQGLLDDGRFETWILRGRFAPRMAWHGLAIALGRHTRRSDVYCLQGSHVIIEPAHAQAFHLDGEVNYSTPITCSVMPGALRLLAPSTAPPDLFCHPGARL